MLELYTCTWFIHIYTCLCVSARFSEDQEASVIADGNILWRRGKGEVAAASFSQWWDGVSSNGLQNLEVKVVSLNRESETLPHFLN